jgi:hypothetical protein
MDHKEQIVMYLFIKVQELLRKMKKNEITNEELIRQIEAIEELLRDYFNLSD